MEFQQILNPKPEFVSVNIALIFFLNTASDFAINAMICLGKGNIYNSEKLIEIQ